MPVPADPYDFVNGTTADGDQVDLRFKRLFDTLNPGVVGLDATNVKSGILKLAVNADRKLAFGNFSPGVGFAGANRGAYSIPHGLGTTPVWWIAMPGYISAANTSTGQNEAVIASRNGEDATNLVLQVVLTNGATAAVGPSGIFWAAIA